MSEDVVAELVTLVVRELKLDPARVDADTPLFEGGLELDSFAVVDLVARIEEHFDVRLSDTDFSPENFVDLKTLGGVVQGYRSRQAAASEP